MYLGTSLNPLGSLFSQLRGPPSPPGMVVETRENPWKAYSRALFNAVEIIPVIVLTSPADSMCVCKF